MRVGVGRRKRIRWTEGVVGALAPIMEPVRVMLLRPGDEDSRDIVAGALGHLIARQHLMRGRPLARQRLDQLQSGHFAYE